MTDLARYFERYRQSPKSGATRATEVTEPARHCNAQEFLTDDLSPGDDISRVTRVTDRSDVPSQNTEGLVTVVTQHKMFYGLRKQSPMSLVKSIGGRAKTSDPTHFAWCGQGERSGAMIVPFGTEATGHTWLHSQCWAAWYANRCEALTGGAAAD